MKIIVIEKRFHLFIIGFFDRQQQIVLRQQQQTTALTAKGGLQASGVSSLSAELTSSRSCLSQISLRVYVIVV